MRRTAILLTLIATLLTPALASSQTKGGIIAGPGLSQVAAENDEYQEAANTEFSYSIGLQGAYEFEEFIAVKPEILFSHRTWQTEGGAYGPADYNFSYIEVPILLRAAVPLAGAIAPKLIAGPHMGIFIDGERETDSSEGGLLGGGGGGDTDYDFDDVNPVQFGITVGAGVDINVGDVVLTPDVRYVRNITPVFDDSGDDVHHQNWMFMFGLLY